MEHVVLLRWVFGQECCWVSRLLHRVRLGFCTRSELARAVASIRVRFVYDSFSASTPIRAVHGHELIATHGKMRVGTKLATPLLKYKSHAALGLLRHSVSVAPRRCAGTSATAAPRSRASIQSQPGRPGALRLVPARAPWLAAAKAAWAAA
eukprot:5363571-Pleurochrysis_carterae.AAC.5